MHTRSSAIALSFAAAAVLVVLFASPPRASACSICGGSWGSSSSHSYSHDISADLLPLTIGIGAAIPGAVFLIADLVQGMRPSRGWAIGQTVYGVGLGVASAFALAEGDPSQWGVLGAVGLGVSVLMITEAIIGFVAPRELDEPPDVMLQPMAPPGGGFGLTVKGRF